VDSEGNHPFAQTVVIGDRAVVKRAESYIHSRQSSRGGFCFYRTEYVDEPNLHDTYYAVAALTLWGLAIPRRDELLRFVDRFPIWGLSYLYHYALTLDLLGQAALVNKERLEQIRRLTIPAAPPQGSGRVRAWLENTLMSLELKQRLVKLPGHSAIAGFVSTLEDEGGGFGDKANLWDTFLALRILALLGQRQTTPGTYGFIAARQVPALGFALTADSLMANLDVLYAGVQCCAMLEAPIAYRNDVLSGVLACQSADGGFSRAPAARPDLEATYRALQTLHSLNRPPEHGSDRGQNGPFAISPGTR
jgi:hypothetical protein